MRYLVFYYYREAQGRLFAIDSFTVGADRTETLMIDMSLTVGDSIHLKYDFPTFYLKVDSINTIRKEDGLDRRVMYLICMPNGSGGQLVWIKGIGNTYSLFDPKVSNCIIDGGDNYLTCYFENDELVYKDPDFKTCWETTSTINLTEEEHNISVYPNPALSQLTIQCTAESVYPIKYKIVNLIVQVLSQGTIIDNSQSSLSVALLLSGIYIIYVQTTNGRTQAIKWVKD